MKNNICLLSASVMTLGFALTACNPVAVSHGATGATVQSAASDGPDSGLGVGDGNPGTPTFPPIPTTPAPTPTPVPPTTTTTTPPDIDSPVTKDPATAAARCAQLQASLPPLGPDNYDSIATGIVRQVLNGQSINEIIAAIADVEAYFKTIGEVHVGDSNMIMSAQTIGDVSAGFGHIFIVGRPGQPNTTVGSVIAGAPATIVLCNADVDSVAFGVGTLVMVNSHANELIGAAITVVEVNSSITKSTVGLLTVKK